jgi:hypothetical protein
MWAGVRPGESQLCMRAEVKRIRSVSLEIAVAFIQVRAFIYLGVLSGPSLSVLCAAEWVASRPHARAVCSRRTVRASSLPSLTGDPRAPTTPARPPRVQPSPIGHSRRTWDGAFSNFRRLRAEALPPAWVATIYSLVMFRAQQRSCTGAVSTDGYSEVL